MVSGCCLEEKEEEEGEREGKDEENRCEGGEILFSYSSVILQTLLLHHLQNIFKNPKDFECSVVGCREKNVVCMCTLNPFLCATIKK